MHPRQQGPSAAMYSPGQPTTYVSKWVTFAASAFIQSCAGLSYSFSVYSPVLKQQLDLTQTQLSAVGSFVNLGGYFAILAGAIYDCTKKEHKLGPRLVVWLGSLTCFCGYLGLYLLASGKAPGDYLQALLFAACAGNAGPWFDTSTLVTNIRNFPDERGFVVGILKAFFGLSASIYTSIYVATFDPDAVSYLLMLSIVPPVLCALLAFLVNHVPFVEASETFDRSTWLSTEGRFLLSFFLVAAIAVYQMATAALEGQQSLTLESREIITAGLLVLLALVALLPYHSGSFWAVYSHRQYTEEDSPGHSPPLSPAPSGDELNTTHLGPSGGPGGSSSSGDRSVLIGSRSGLEHRHSRLAVQQTEHGPTTSFTQQQQQSADQRHQGQQPKRPPHSGGREDGQLSGRSTNGPHSSSSNGTGLKQTVSKLLHGLTADHGSQSSSREGSPSRQPAGRAAPAAGNSSSSSSSSRRRGEYKALPTADDGVPVHAATSSSSSMWHGAAKPPPAVAGHGEEGCEDPSSSRKAEGVSHQHPSGLPHLTTWQMLRQPDFWAYFLQFMMGTGVCLSYLNNLGQLVVALGGDPHGRVVFVSLFSVANAAGRLLMGYVPEQALHNSGTPRPWFLVYTAGIMTVAAFVTSTAPLGGLYLVSLLLGAVFGAHWSLLPAIMADVYGLTHLAANYCFLQLAPACGSYLLATWLTGHLYDKAAQAGGDIHACTGHDCFGPAFRILTAGSAVSTCFCVYAAVRSRGVYRLVAGHLQHARGTAAQAEAADV